MFVKSTWKGDPIPCPVCDPYREMDMDAYTNTFQCPRCGVSFTAHELASIPHRIQIWHLDQILQRRLDGDISQGKDSLR